MFTGIVEAVGRIARYRSLPGGGARIAVEAPFARELEVGESVAVDGACLTVVRPPVRGAFEADLSPETLARTTLGGAKAGRRVNLERALLATSRLGGHVVSGHVDAVTRVASVREQSGFREYRFEIPKGSERYVVEKGSIALDGISLTVASLSKRELSVAIIPKTLEATVLGDRRAGSRVNVEFDVLAKYVEKMLGAR